MSKIKNGGLDQYGPERFGRLILPQSEKMRDRVKNYYTAVVAYCGSQSVSGIGRMKKMIKKNIHLCFQ